MSDCEGLIWQHRYRNHLWRAQLLNWHGERKLHLWPWFEKDGTWRPCKPDYTKGGLTMPIEAALELARALAALAPPD
jgi:hypothetical protein